MTRNSALIYARKSVTRTAADAISPERQRAACLAEVQRRGWTCDPARDIYVDADAHQSGKNPLRPAWLRMKHRLATDPTVLAVIVESLSRATRSTKDFFQFLGELEERGVALVSLKESFATDSAMGRAMVGFIALINALESDLASERMSGTIEFKRRAKGRHWGLTPFGCERQGDDHVLIPSKSGVWLHQDGTLGPEPSPTGDSTWRGYHDALRRLYELCAAGDASFAALANKLNLEGWRFRDRKGQPRAFTEDDTRRILGMVDVYAGSVTIGTRKGGNLSEVLPGSHQPILPPELCQQVRQVLESRSALAWAFMHKEPRRVYLLGSILTCADCGQKFIGAFEHGRQVYRHRRLLGCTGPWAIPAEVLDEQILARLRALRFPPEARQRLREQITGPLARGYDEREALKARTLKRLEALRELRLDGDIEREEYLRRRAELQHTLADLADVGATPAADPERVFDELEAIGATVARGTAEERHRAVLAVYQQIAVRQGIVVEARPHNWCQGIV